MLGKTFLKMDNKFSAEYYLKLVTQYPAKTVEDHQVNLFIISYFLKTFWEFKFAYIYNFTLKW